MRVRVEIPDDTGDESLSLYRWLADESSVRRHGQLRRETGDDGGHMGDPVAVLSLIVGSGLALGNLLVAIAQWRSTRPRPHRVTVELPDRTIAIETSDADEALEIARRLEVD